MLNHSRDTAVTPTHMASPHGGQDLTSSVKSSTRLSNSHSIFHGRVWAGQKEEEKTKSDLAQQQAGTADDALAQHTTCWEQNTMPCFTMTGLSELMLSDQTPVASAEPWGNAGNICHPFGLVYHLEKARPSTVQADATVTATSEEIF
ncbi:hypothetical protein TURU_076386 [Turdus rufiventris]|nr:hypothetical protein TURU_076386 [Turdus rufiventris]